MSYNLKGVVATAVICLPLLAEVVRKYILASNFVLLVADLLALSVAGALVARVATRPVLILTAATLGLVCWKLISVVLGHQNVTLGLIGIRNFIVPCAFLIAGVVLCRTLGMDRTAALIHKTFTVWLTVMSAVMVAQLLVGRDHWLNAVPEGLGDETAGIGDYTVGDIGLDFLFRPTSIFLHTGKSGSVAFVLTTYRLFYAVGTGMSFWRLSRNVLLDLTVLLLSGQRAAMLGYAIALLISFLMRAQQSMALRLVWLSVYGVVAAVVMTGVGSALERDDLNLAKLIFARFVSGLADVPLRVADNIVAPAGYVWELYALVPAGAGAFSLGAKAFGGQLLYEVVPIGTAENSWLRLLGEEGVIGLLGGLAFWGGLMSYALFLAMRRKEMSGQSELLRKRLSLGAAFVLGVLLFWANTHDVLGNTTVMSLSMVLFGIIGARHRRITTASKITRMSVRPRAFETRNVVGNE